MIAHPIFSDFSAGEESPRMLGRSDLPAYQKGARTIENFVPHLQGGVERRPGTIYVADSYSHSVKGRLIPWQGPVNQYHLELFVSGIRIYKASTGTLVHTITTAGASVTAWTEDQIAELDWDFDGATIMYIVHPSWKPKKLVHTTPTSDTAWALTEPAITVTGYTDTTLFNATDKYPAVVCFFATRLIFAAPNLYPNTIFFSQSWNVGTGTNRYETFTTDTSSPYDSFAGFSVAPAFNRGGKIMWLAGRNALVGGSTSGEFIIGSGENGLDPNYPGDIKTWTFYGGSGPKARVGDGILFVQKGKRKLRELIVTDAAQYKCNDLMLVSDHIGGAGIVDVDFQMFPTPRIYATRVDGQIAVLTYEALYDMKAWSRFITGDPDLEDGFDCVSITADSEGMDQVWAIVKRDVDGETKRFIERFAPWSPFDWDTFEESIYCDCSTTIHLDQETIEGCVIDTLVTIEITGHPFVDGDIIRITAHEVSHTYYWGYVSYYTSYLVGIYSLRKTDANHFVLRNEADTEDIDATKGIAYSWEEPIPATFQIGDTITGETSGNTAVITGIDEERWELYFGSANVNDPFYDDGAVMNAWETWGGVSSYSFLMPDWDDQGLDDVIEIMKVFAGYLRYAGKTLQVFADSAVQAECVVDENGDFEIAEYAHYITFGLEYDSVLLLMPIEAGVGEGSAQGRKKRVDRITLRLIDSVGCMVGPALDDLYLAKFRQTTAEMGEVTQPMNGDIEIPFPGEYETFGNVYVVGNEPLPLTVVAVMPRMETTE